MLCGKSLSSRTLRASQSLAFWPLSAKGKRQHGRKRLWLSLGSHHRDEAARVFEDGTRSQIVEMSFCRRALSRSAHAHGGEGKARGFTQWLRSGCGDVVIFPSRAGAWRRGRTSPLARTHREREWSNAIRIERKEIWDDVSTDEGSTDFVSSPTNLHSLADARYQQVREWQYSLADRLVGGAVLLGEWHRLPTVCRARISDELRRYKLSDSYPEDQPWFLRNLTYAGVRPLWSNRNQIFTAPTWTFWALAKSSGHVFAGLLKQTASMDYTDNIHRGLWAGHRFDITTLDRHKHGSFEGTESKDVSEEVAFEGGPPASVSSCGGNHNGQTGFEITATATILRERGTRWPERSIEQALLGYVMSAYIQYGSMKLPWERTKSVNNSVPSRASKAYWTVASLCPICRSCVPSYPWFNVTSAPPSSKSFVNLP